MQKIIVLVAFAAMLASPSVAGSSQGSTPGIGTFSYSG